MKRQFADTSLFVAFLNRADSHHKQAVDVMAHSSGPIFTTAWVIVELGNFLSGSLSRHLFAGLVRDLRQDPRFTILPPDKISLDAGIQIYNRRKDKTWSLTDCISFVVMREKHLSEALTADHHFEQAGFVAILK